MKGKGLYNRKWLRLLFLLYPVVSVFLFAFSFIAKYFINKALAKTKGFRGHIQAIRISPFVIRMEVKGLFLDKIDTVTNERSLFLSAESITIYIDWAKLWSGIVWAELTCTAPGFTFSKEKSNRPATPVPDSTVTATNPMYDLDLGMDIYINKLQLCEGKLEFVDTSKSAPVILHIEGLEFTASNISTKLDPGINFQSDVLIRAAVYEGQLNANMRVNLFSRTPDFTLDAGISGVNMVLLNDFFRAYAKFDVHSGTMGMHSEIQAAGGRFKGYVEPTINDLQILGPEDRHDGIANHLWEGVLGLAVAILEDHSKEQLTAQIRFDESFKDPQVHVGLAVTEVLTNAFVHGLTPYLHNVVKIDL